MWISHILRRLKYANDFHVNARVDRDKSHQTLDLQTTFLITHLIASIQPLRVITGKPGASYVMYLQTEVPHKKNGTV